MFPCTRPAGHRGLRFVTHTHATAYWWPGDPWVDRYPTYSVEGHWVASKGGLRNPTFVPKSPSNGWTDLSRYPTLLPYMVYEWVDQTPTLPGIIRGLFLLNLKPDHWSGSPNPLNLGPDLIERVQMVRFRFRVI